MTEPKAPGKTRCEVTVRLDQELIQRVEKIGPSFRLTDLIERGLGLVCDEIEQQVVDELDALAKNDSFTEDDFPLDPQTMKPIDPTTLLNTAMKELKKQPRTRRP